MVFFFLEVKELDYIDRLDRRSRNCDPSVLSWRAANRVSLLCFSLFPSNEIVASFVYCHDMLHNVELFTRSSVVPKTPNLCVLVHAVFYTITNLCDFFVFVVADRSIVRVAHRLRGNGHDSRRQDGREQGAAKHDITVCVPHPLRPLESASSQGICRWLRLIAEHIPWGECHYRTSLVVWCETGVFLCLLTCRKLSVIY